MVKGIDTFCVILLDLKMQPEGERERITTG